MPTVPVSIIIPTLNEEEYISILLESLARISAPLDIIVVDGHSSDNTCNVVEKYQRTFTGHSSLRLVRAVKRGISFQRNSGAKEARHNILIFCDADVIAPPDTEHARMIEAFTAKNHVIAAPRIISIESRWDIVLFVYIATYIQRILHFLQKPYFAGAYIITTKETFEAIGGFDERIALAEDVDYSIRAGRTGTWGILPHTVAVSSRRFLKYGYSWIFKGTPNLMRLLFTGRVHAGSIFYPFGDFKGFARNDLLQK